MNSTNGGRSSNNCIYLGIGDYVASRVAGEFLKTLSLGSCVAAIFIDSRTRTVGMIHVALPDSGVQPDKSRRRPGYFADTGIPALLDLMTGMGCSRNGQGMEVKIVGGANVVNHASSFNVGVRNYSAIRKILRGYGLIASAEDVGGHACRNVTIPVFSGRVLVSSPGKTGWYI